MFVLGSKGDMEAKAQVTRKKERHAWKGRRLVHQVCCDNFLPLLDAILIDFNHKRSPARIKQNKYKHAKQNKSKVQKKTKTNAQQIQTHKPKQNKSKVPKKCKRNYITKSKRKTH